MNVFITEDPFNQMNEIFDTSFLQLQPTKFDLPSFLQGVLWENVFEVDEDNFMTYDRFTQESTEFKYNRLLNAGNFCILN